MATNKHSFPDRLLTAKEASELLGLSVRTVDRLTKRGKIPLCRPGGTRTARYRLYTLMRLMEQDERSLA